MWTLKNTTIKRWTQDELTQYNVQHPQNPLPAGRLLQLELGMVFTDGTQDVSVSTWVSTESDVKNTVQSNLARLNEQATLEEKVSAGNFDPSVTEEKTPEEIAAEEAATAKQLWSAKRAALKAMRQDMMEAKDLGVEPTTEQTAAMVALAEWVRDNASEEYYT